MNRAAASAWSIGRLPWTLAPRGSGSGRDRSGLFWGVAAAVVGVASAAALLASSYRPKPPPEPD